MGGEQREGDEGERARILQELREAIRSRRAKKGNGDRSWKVKGLVEYEEGTGAEVRVKDRELRRLEDVVVAGRDGSG